MAASHCAVRQNVHAHRYGTSVANQGIENFWSHLPRIFTSLLVNFFQTNVWRRPIRAGKSSSYTESFERQFLVF